MARDRHRALSVACLAVVTALAVQVALPSYPLSNDGGSHLYNASLTRALMVGDTAWTGPATIRPELIPNWGVPLLLTTLGGATAAAKIIIALCLLSTFVAVWYCARVWSPGRSVSPVALFVANSWFLWMGFWGFCLGTALAFGCIGWVKANWDRPKWTSATSVGVWLLGILTFHPMPALLVVLVVVVQLFFDRGDPTLARRSRWPFAAGAAIGLLGVGLLSHRLNDGFRALFVQELRNFANAVLTFPIDAFETVRWPHADGKFIVGILILVTAMALFSRESQRTGSPVLLIAAAVLLLGRLVANDAQLGGAFVTTRLGFFSFSLLCIWSWPRASDRVQLIAGWCVVASAAIGAALHLEASRRVSQAMEEVTRAGRIAMLTPGTTLVRIRAHSPRADSVYGLRRLRLPYLLTHSVDWVAAERRAVHLTNYELLGLNFTTRLRPGAFPEDVIGALRTLEEPDTNGHASDLAVVLAHMAPDVFALIGDDMARELALLEQAGYRVISQGGHPTFVRFLRRSTYSQSGASRLHNHDTRALVTERTQRR